MKKITKKLMAVLLAIVCMASLAAACACAAEKVTLAMLRLTSSAPLFIALDKGFFAAEGLDVEPQWFDAAHPIAVATASSKVSVGATGITASLFNMAAGGQRLDRGITSLPGT